MKSVKLAKITAIDLNLTKTSKAGKPYSVAHIEYTQPLEADPVRSFSVDIFHGTLKDIPAMGAAIKLIQVGDEIGIEKTQDGNFWPVTGFVDKAAVPPPKPAFGGGNGGGYKKSFGGGGAKPAFNEAGVKCGAVLHDAVAVAIAQKKELVTVADITTIAEQLLRVSYILETKIKAGEFSSATSTTPAVGVKVEKLATTPTEAVAILNNKIDALDSNTKMGSLPF